MRSDKEILEACIDPEAIETLAGREAARALWLLKECFSRLTDRLLDTGMDASVMALHDQAKAERIEAENKLREAGIEPPTD